MKTQVSPCHCKVTTLQRHPLFPGEGSPSFCACLPEASAVWPCRFSTLSWSCPRPLGAEDGEGTSPSPLRPAKSWACTLASLYPFHLPTIFKLRYQVCQGVPLTLPSLKAGAEHVSQNPLRAKNHLLYCLRGASRCLSCGKCPTSIC